MLGLPTKVCLVREATLEMEKRTLIRDGLLGGLVAGAVFAAAQVLAAAMAGLPPGAPWQLSASLVMGREAFSPVMRGSVFVLGAALHFGLAAVYGAILGLISWKLGKERRNRYTTMLAIGAAYGAVLWLLNLVVASRI